MTARAQRWSWTAVMAVLPFAIMAFATLDLDVTQWPIEARFIAAVLSAIFGVMAATFPGYRGTRP